MPASRRKIRRLHYFPRVLFSRQAAKIAKNCILLRYPVKGRASCPPSKNDPTYLEKHHYHFEMPPPLGKSVEHYLWKGMKPPPCTDTTSDEDMEACTLTLFLCNVPVHTWIVHSFAFSAPLRETFSRGIFFLAKPQRALRHAHPCAALAFSAPLREAFFPRDIFSRQAAMGAKACIPSAEPWRSPRLCERPFSRGIFFSPSRKDRKDLYTRGALASNAPSAGKGFMPFPALTPTTQKTCRTGITLFPRLFSIRQCIVSPLRS